MVALLYGLGAVPFLLLGLLHTAFALLDANHPRRIVPRDPDLIAKMRSAPLAITRETDMWRAWIGFNISHGIGVTVFGATFLLLAVVYPAVLAELTPVRWAAPVIGACYLALSAKYWFRIPLVGTALGTATFASGAILGA